MRTFATITILTLAVAACGGDDSPETASTAADSETTTQMTDTTGADSETTADTTDTTGPDSTTADNEGDTGQPVVIDTDGSVEGAMSVLYLLQEPSVDVRAITISGTGLVSCRKGVEQALGLVALAEAGDIPVACGSTQPSSGDNAFPASYRAAADSLGGVLLPLGGEPSELPADVLLAEVIADADAPVQIYADGPLTNIAAVFDHDLDTDHVAGITLMGGAVDVAGNTADNPDAEWNIWIDPAAAQRVVAADVPVTIVPLDATNDVPVTPMHVNALKSYEATPIAETVNDLMQSVNGVADGFVYFWDQLNAAAMLDPSLVTVEDRTVSVVTEGGPDEVGALRDDPNGYPVQVAVAADREAFESTFFTTLMGEPVASVDLTPDATVTLDGDRWTYDFPAEVPLGPLTVEFENRSDVEAFVPVLWLLEDATIDDLQAWQSTDQPPFTGLAGFAFTAPGASTLTVVDVTFEGTHYVVGIVPEPYSKEIMTTFEAG